MPWIKLDDQFIDHPKIVGLSDGAFRLWLAGLSWSARHLTDGHLSGRGVSTFCAIRYPFKAAQELVDAGLWDPNGDDYVIHDYLEYQPRAHETKELRIKRAEAGSRGGHASVQAKRDMVASGGQQANANPEPEPEPEPEPDQPLTSMHAIEAAGYRRYRSVTGSDIAAIKALIPIYPHELEAAFTTKGKSWGYAAKVIESYREKANGSKPPPGSPKKQTDPGPGWDLYAPPKDDADDCPV